MGKCIDGYHDNHGTKSYAYVLADNALVSVPLISGSRYFGMEIELEFEGEGGECDSCGGSGTWYNEDNDEDVECDDCHGTGHWGESVDDIAENIKIPKEYEDTFVFESDGSLDFGFEMITEPMTKDAIQHFLVQPFVKDLIASSSEVNNGIHIHVSRPDDDVVKRLILLVSKLGDTLKDMTRQSGYAKFYKEGIREGSYNDAYDDLTKAWYMYLKGLDNKLTELYDYALTDRYMALNLRNSRTVEFRFFRFSDNNLDYIKYVNLANSLMDVATNETLENILVSSITVNDDWSLSVEKTGEVITICKRLESMFVNNNPKDITMEDLERFERMVLRDKIEYDIGDWVELDTDIIAMSAWDKYGIGTGREMLNYAYGVIIDKRVLTNRGKGYKVISNEPYLYRIDLYTSSGKKVNADYNYTSHWIKSKVNLNITQEEYIEVMESEVAF